MPRRAELTLAYQPPLDWAALLDFLRPRATPGVERVERDAYRRTVSLPGGPALLEVRPAGEDTLLMTLPGATAEAVARVRRLADLDADHAGIAAHLARDPLLAPLVQAFPGVRLPGGWDGFELAVRAIIGQQVSVAGATTIAGRIAVRFGAATALGEGFTRLFPPPAALAEADLTGIGFPTARGRAINALATAVRDGELALDGTQPILEAKAALLRLPGIGPWTAEYVALRALLDRDAFPASDLVLRRALADASRAEAWRPYRAHAAIYLWRAAAMGSSSK